MTKAELDAIEAAKQSTPSSLANGLNYTSSGTPTDVTVSDTRKRPGATGTTVPSTGTTTTLTDEEAKRSAADFIPSYTPSVIPKDDPNNITIGQGTETINDGSLLASLRRGILTGAQVQGGARTFSGGKGPSSAGKKNATGLRIGKTRLDTARNSAKRKKQTNTLGLNLGSSVGLQV